MKLPKHVTAKASMIQLVKTQLESLPECSFSFGIISWDYDNCEFNAVDYETGKRYTLTLELALKGFKRMENAVRDREIPGIFKFVDQMHDAAEWDAIAVDILMQYSLLGELVYG
jgi:hypothetical protein